MRHLSPEEFVDALDGAGGAWVREHVASCAACREQLRELNALAREAEVADVPEPSPLFWDHFSARVRTAVAAEAAGLSSGSSRASMAEYVRALGGSWRVFVPVAAVAVLAIALFVRLPFSTERAGSYSATGSPAAAAPVEAGNSAATAAVPAATPDVAALAEDESLAFVADLASGLDWNVAAEIGLTPSSGVDTTVFDLDDAERTELQRLLNEAIGNGVTM